MTSAADSLSDEELVLRIRGGDSVAFSALVYRHSRRFYAAAYRIMLSKEDAEDVVQEAFLKLWNGKAVWQEGKGAKFTTWFYRVVVNQARDHLAKRKDGRHTELTEELIQSGDMSAHDSMEKQQESQVVIEALAELPERQRTALTLFYTEELSQKETAEIMGITPKAVESLIGRAKLAMRDRLQTKVRVYA